VDTLINHKEKRKKNKLENIKFVYETEKEQEKELAKLFNDD
jgi:hypothetical protein